MMLLVVILCLESTAGGNNGALVASERLIKIIVLRVANTLSIAVDLIGLAHGDTRCQSLR